MSKRNREKRSNKRRGPYSLENASRVIRRAELPADDPLRKRVTDEVRRAVERAVPDFDIFSEGTGESLSTGVIHVAAEFLSSAPPEMRKLYVERAIAYFRNQITLEVQDYHKRNVDKTDRRESAAPLEEKFSATPKADDTLRGPGVNQEALAKLFTKYYVSLRNHASDLEEDDDPRGAPNMRIYACLELLCDLLADAPDRYGTMLDDEVLTAIPERVAYKRERLKPKESTINDEPAAADGQLQVDPLETVPTEDNGGVQLLRSEGREEPGDDVRAAAVPAEEAP